MVDLMTALSSELVVVSPYSILLACCPCLNDQRRRSFNGVFKKPGLNVPALPLWTGARTATKQQEEINK